MRNIYTFNYPREKFDERNISKETIRLLIKRHEGAKGQMLINQKYHRGEHEILNRKKQNPKAPNSKLVCNHAADIVTTSTAYFGGNPINYKSKGDISVLTDAFHDAELDSVDGEIIQNLAVYGFGFEYTYTREGEKAVPISKSLPPLNTFMVYDNSIEENELFGVYYYEQKDDTNTEKVKITKYYAVVLTENFRWVLSIDDVDGDQELDEKPEPHYYGEIPLIEYRNNKNGRGDFEGVISLIDAYNILMSDRIDDKQQFIDSILAIYGVMISDDGEESEAIRAMKEMGLMELPEATKAEYITRTFNETEVEVLKKAVEEDIHKFSHIPCLTDDSFAGNTSGVAMEFKILGLENITKIKERFHRKGLMKRIRLYRNFLKIKGKSVDINGIEIKYSRSLPKNVLELSQVVGNLWGKVSKKTLLTLLPFVQDVDAELEAIAAEAEEEARRQRELFKDTMNTPFGQSKEDDLNGSS